MSEYDPRPDDELVSALLDGEATPEEEARVTSDPELAARLAEFRAVAEAVGAPVPVAQQAARDAAIARAIATSPADELAAARAKRADTRARRWLPIASVAAAVLVVLAAIPLLSRLGGGGSDDSALSNAAATTAAAGAEAAPDRNAASTTVPGPLAAPLAAADLGVIANPADLRVAVERVLSTQDAQSASTFADAETLESGEASAGGGRFDVNTCAADLRTSFPNTGPLLLQTTATFQGTPVAVLVYGITDPGAGPTRQLLAVDLGTCVIRNAQAF
jgi:negative regulator of sigma E activity